MKNYFLITVFLSSIIYSQTDYSKSWEDFYSYNNVKDFVKVDDVIYALSENAIFKYNTATDEIEKLSSIQGLSSEATSSIHYNESFKRIVIGYQTGLIEIIDDNGTITTAIDLQNFSAFNEKTINHIEEYDNILYLSTPFGIVLYNIEKLEFGDTYFIDESSTSLNINQIKVFDGNIYAATENGIFSADITSKFLISFNRWKHQFVGRNFTQITLYNNQLYVAEGNILYRLDGSKLSQIRVFNSSIAAIKTSSSNLCVTLKSSAIVLNSNMSQVAEFRNNSNFNFTLNNSFFEDETIYLSTKEYGILKANLNQPSDYNSISPDGPLLNSVFSIAANSDNLWVVYGGYDLTFTPLNRRGIFSHFNGKNWINTIYNYTDLNHITIDKSAENRVYISSFGDTRNVNSVSTGGLLVIEDDKVKTFYNHLNSPLEDLAANNPSRVTVRVAGTAFDSNGNLWIANIGFEKELKKLSPDGSWSSIDMRSVKTSTSLGLNEITIDKSNNIWYGSRRNGVYVYNENGDRKKSLVATANIGNLPDLNVRTVAADSDNNLWLGTNFGLVVYYNASEVFNDTTPNARAIIINANEDGFGDKFLGDQTINSIAIDGANNKWIGTDRGGVFYTNNDGQNTLANFNKQNSPLPSNKILKIAIDDTTEKVYFATDNGIVAYNSNVVPYGDALVEAYAYPNPVLKNHKTVTIDGRNGNHLPNGTNIKIIDVAGNLVYETNIIADQELKGGKAIWDKKNLAGNKVASGVYIVLLTNENASKTISTKIAIVN